MDGGTERTGCYAFFLIKSAGVLDFDKGFLPEPDSAFDPDEITALLGLQPFTGPARPGLAAGGGIPSPPGMAAVRRSRPSAGWTSAAGSRRRYGPISQPCGRFGSGIT